MHKTLNRQTRILVTAATLLQLATASVASAGWPGWLEDGLSQQVEDVLRSIGRGDAKAIQARINGRVVRLSGTVHSQRTRAIAESSVAEISQVDRVVNSINVTSRPTGEIKKVEGDKLESWLEGKLGLDSDQLGLVASPGVVRIDGLVTDRELPARITRMLRRKTAGREISNAVTWVEALPSAYGGTNKTKEDL